VPVDKSAHHHTHHKDRGAERIDDMLGWLQESDEGGEPVSGRIRVESPRQDQSGWKGKQAEAEAHADEAGLGPSSSLSRRRPEGCQQGKDAAEEGEGAVAGELLPAYELSSPAAYG
jgi:hypothetical protein